MKDQMIGHLYVVLMARLDLDGSISKERKFTRVANVNLTWTLLGFSSKINKGVLDVDDGILYHVSFFQSHRLNSERLL